MLIQRETSGRTDSNLVTCHESGGQEVVGRGQGGEGSGRVGEGEVLGYSVQIVTNIVFVLYPSPPNFNGAYLTCMICHEG